MVAFIGFHNFTGKYQFNELVVKKSVDFLSGDIREKYLEKNMNKALFFFLSVMSTTANCNAQLLQNQSNIINLHLKFYL